MSLIKSILHQLGLSSDPTKNFTIGVPAVPDGTMKLARGNAGATTQDIMTVDAAGKVAFPQNAQTWQDVTASRAFNTDFVNNTGQPITVSILIGAPAGQPVGCSIIVAGLIRAGCQVTTPSGVNNQNAYCQIPNGATYRVQDVAGTAHTWMELR